MKMVKSLLLGSAAGLVAVVGAQAADLPVKAKPVEYVKVCSLYGAGYYYMPGTDICIKLGGYVRYQFTVNPGSSITAGPFSGAGGLNNRATSFETAHRTRALITVDTRQQTAYGTLRTYILLGYSQDSTAPESTSPAVYMTRGFLQIAGFTFGKATSFFDIVPGASFAYNAGMFFHPDTGDAGKMLAAYTAQFGNGVSGTIALEQARVRGISRVGAVTTSAVCARSVSLRTAPTVQQHRRRLGRACRSILTWSATSASISPGAPGWSALPPTSTVASTSAARRMQRCGTQNSGGPDSKIGWAAHHRLHPEPADDRSWRSPVGRCRLLGRCNRLRGGHSVGWRDQHRLQPGRRQSASASGASKTASMKRRSRRGRLRCGALGGCGQIQLTTAWSASLAFEHLWTPALRTSWYGSYIDVSHNAAGNFLICNSLGTRRRGGVYQAGIPAVTGCDTDWSSLERRLPHAVGAGQGSRHGYRRDLQQAEHVEPELLRPGGRPRHWSPDRGAAAELRGWRVRAGAPVPCYRNVKDMDAVTTTFRIQRDFLP